ncbi:MAG: hypothetical protein PUP92_01660 [Rhizonema sp. PD38]|nr:hypothetical protein [Rhizonema sp. PD38]
MRKIFSLFLITVVFILITTFKVVAENNSWNLGKYSFDITTSQGLLTETLNCSVGLSSYDFDSRVGGIAFEAVATPEENLKNQKIELLYDHSKPDKERFAVRIGGKIYHPILPDWELFPIANYANSKSNAVVSLFGHNTTNDSYYFFTTGDIYNLTYHPAFNNTLLGLRLLQADIIPMDLGEFWQLPQFKSKTILGYGEEQNSVSNQDWRRPAEEINQVFKGKNKTFQSWVFTDCGAKVKFSVKDNNLNLSGYPYYYFWNSDFPKYKKQLYEYKRQLDEYEKQGDSLLKIGLVQQHNEIVKKHNDLVKIVNNLRPKVFEVPTLTENLKGKFNSFYKFNPTVYESAIRTMRYAAFFRYVKTHNNSSWQKFLKQLEIIKLEPIVQTPTQWVHSSFHSRASTLTGLLDRTAALPFLYRTSLKTTANTTVDEVMSRK